MQPLDATHDDASPRGGGATAALEALRRDLARHVVPAAVLLACTAWAAGALASFGPWYPAKVLLCFALATWLLRRGLGAHLPHERFGPANRVTLARLCGVLLLAGAVGEPVAGLPVLAWAMIVLATVAALLDAVDGTLARRSGLASAFGARFDMETDALLILVLALLVWQLNQAGAWVLLAGVLRYAFVAAGAAWHWLNRPLPPSVRRQTVCVVQIVALIVCLGPVIPRPWSVALAAGTLAALSWSFAVDVAWLARRRHQPLETS